MIFVRTSQLSFKCCINIEYHQTKLRYTFFSSNILNFVQKKPIKVQVFEIFEYLGQNLLNSWCQFWTDKSIPLQFWHHSSLSWDITPLEILSSYIFNFRHKVCHEGPNLETFKCSGENLLNSSCQFLETEASFPSNFVSI